MNVSETDPADIALAGAANFRDIGGPASRLGGVVRRGLLYRSAELATLTDEDLPIIDALSIRLVFDLRSTGERSSRPSRAWQDATFRVRLRDYTHSGADLAAILADPATDTGTLRDMMLDVYRTLADDLGEPLREIVQAIVSGDLPLLFHCAAGKDRTGAVAALLLEMLGVARSDIVADFVRSDRHIERNRHRLRRHGARAGVPDVLWEPLLRADPSYIEQMFAVLDARPGGVTGFFEAVGIDGDMIDVTRSVLLDRDAVTA